MNKIILSIGSSLGNKHNTIVSAISDIEKNIGVVEKISSYYETEPWGFEDENMFLNIAVSVLSELLPNEVLEKIHRIEDKYGRIRTGKGYSARTLDIDIVFWNEIIHYEQHLKIPHPLAHKRKFVLQPVAEIEPDLLHPVLQLTVSELLANCSDETLMKRTN